MKANHGGYRTTPEGGEWVLMRHGQFDDRYACRGERRTISETNDLDEAFRWSSFDSAARWLRSTNLSESLWIAAKRPRLRQ